MRVAYLFFGFLLAVHAAIAQPRPASQTEAAATLQRILERVQVAAGRTPQSVRLQVQGEQSRRVAYLDASSPGARPRLEIDSYLYQQCRAAFGAERAEALLAFVIGHELAHAYLGHRAHQGFAELPESLASSRRAVSRQQEAAADSVGLFFSFLAGYDVQDDLPLFFHKLYGTWYQLSQPLPGYPSLPERQRTQLPVSQLRRLAQLIGAGQALYVFGEWDAAAQCFSEVVGAGFGLKEVLNDLAVCRLQQVIAAGPPARLRPFAFPLEWDARNRLLLDEQRAGTPPEPRQARWLQEALGCLRRAESLEATYSTATLNRAVAHVLASQYYDCLGALERHPAHPNAALLRGMAWWGLGQTEMARRAFAQVRQGKGHEAAYNYAVFEHLAAGKSLGTLSLPRRSAARPWPAVAPPAVSAWTDVIAVNAPQWLKIKVNQHGSQTTYHIELPAHTLQIVHNGPGSRLRSPLGPAVGSSARPLPPPTRAPLSWGASGHLLRFGDHHAVLVHQETVRGWYTARVADR